MEVANEELVDDDTNTQKAMQAEKFQRARLTLQVEQQAMMRVINNKLMYE